MNEHDSERIAGLLEDDGYVAVTDEADADVVVLNTCCIRENADNKLYGTLGWLKPWKEQREGRQIVVAGCLAQKDRDLVRQKAPYVDVVLGTHNVHRTADLIDQARRSRPDHRDPRRGRARRSGDVSPVHCRRAARPPTTPGSRSRSAATTPVPSASCLQSAAPRSVVRLPMSLPRSLGWRRRVSARSRCSARTSTATAATFRSRLARPAISMRACDRCSPSC